MVATLLDDGQDSAEDVLQGGDLVSAYRIDRLVGTGGMGWVYRAAHVTSAHVVALKVLRAEQVGHERSIDRMMREAHILGTKAHPGMPQLFDSGVLPDRRPWIAMELVDGSPLSERIARGPMPAADVRDVVRDVAAVLAAAHTQGIVHRDLKPENILVVRRDRRFPVRLIDWGIAHHEGGARYTSFNEAIGTPTYMAPEQARGGPTGPYCDIYGLGVVAYKALTGRAPFVGHTSVEILVQHMSRPVPPLAPRCPDAPIELVELVERMLAKSYPSRPTAQEIVWALDALRDRRYAPSYVAAVEETGPITARVRTS